MTLEERVIVEDFALRQAHRVLLEELLGSDIFSKIQADHLNEKEQSYLLQLAQEEEIELREYSKIHYHPKIDRLLDNVTAVQKILGK